MLQRINFLKSNAIQTTDTHNLVKLKLFTNYLRLILVFCFPKFV